ncbi:hypothetical protein E4T50_06207 [Aureobasidium sp. EXF-12298]|nr:hypothetical protein E4T50_06207 [Aureobasidium sp. EXF-12298]KAI4759420.1 hypothetical protein E4T51_07560 [Aureobasidium sp. EXF-12344]KAI4777445.1 hypothetical protein E4T52_07618 [Aureobasidium sp. EXF-3400]
MSTTSTPPQTGGSSGRAVSTPNKWPSSKLYKEMVSLLVGPNKEKYNLHKGLLCFYSDFFRAAFKGSFKEAEEGKIELPDVGTEVFEAFQVWLYSRSLRVSENHGDSSDRPPFLSFHTLAHLWVLGDKYQIPLLQNCAIDALLEKLKEENKFSTGVVAIAYTGTMVGSPLRKLAIDIHVLKMIHKPGENCIFRESCLPDWSKESLVDFAHGVSEAWERKLPQYVWPSTEKCHYHVHATGEHC